MTVIEDDQALLRRFVNERDHGAFEAIVHRHISLVYSAALRQVGDPHLAEDVTQSVFLILWRVGHRISARAALAGWLFNTARYASANAMKMENRRRHHERKAVREDVMEPGTDWESLTPLLDRGLSKLARADRDAVLLRFFEAQSLAEVGAALGVSEEAARKRVSRGVEKLRAYFCREGVALSALGVSESLARFGAVPVPSHLVGVVSAGVAGGAAAVSAASATIAKMPMMTMFIGKLATAVLVGLVLSMGILAVTPMVRREIKAAASVPAASQPVTQPVASVQETVSGHVLGADGRAVGGAEVYFSSMDVEGRHQLIIAAQCEGDGTFSIRVPVGSRLDRREVFAQVPNVGISSQMQLGAGVMQLQLAPAVSAQLPILAPGGKPAGNLRLRLSTVLFRNDAGGFRELKFVRVPSEAAKGWATTTDGEGKCVIHGLPAGSQVGLETDDDRYAQLSFGDRFRLGDKGITFAKPIQLYKAASIVGIVTDPVLHQSVAGVGVYAQSTDHSVNQAGASTTTDTNGHYELKQLAPCQVVVASSLSEKPLERTAAAHEVSVVEGEEQRVDFQFTRGGTITGRIRDQATGKPLGGLWVGFQGPARPRDAAGIQSTNADAEGSYTLRVPAGKQYVYLGRAPDGYSSTNKLAFEPEVAEGQTCVVNFDLVPNHERGVSGVVRGASGQIAPGATVLCEDPMGGIIDAEKTTTADAEGRFHFNSVAPNSLLRARWKELSTETAIPIGRDGGEYSLTVSDKGRFDLVVEITDDGGIGIPGASVYITMWSGVGGTGGQPHLVDSEAKTRFSSIHTDKRYSVSAKAPGYGEAQTEFVPKVGEREKRLTLKLREESSEIAGVVVDVAGKPVPNVTVNLNGSETGSKSTRTDAAGRFSFSAAPGVRGMVSLDLPAGKSVRLTSVYGRAGQTDLKLVFPADH